mgnify:FL=1
MYWFNGELPLLETKGNEVLSRPLASITIIEATHFIQDGKTFTRGKYLVKDVFDPNDAAVNFEWMKRT